MICKRATCSCGLRSELLNPVLDSAADVRAAGPIITADPELNQQKTELERFLREHVYRHPQLLVLRHQWQDQLRDVRRLPGQACIRCRLALPNADRSRRLDRRSVADYLAGMTDRYAQQEYQRLFA